MNIQHSFINNEIWEPLYQNKLTAHPWEIELFNNESIRRLKHLHHFGAASLYCPIVHSRFEHTLGVWSLTNRFFFDSPELRIAAILHDVGHLPFSHAIEKTLGFNHHAITEEKVSCGSIANILKKYGFNPLDIIDILNNDTALSSKTDFLGLDHLDSFLRDTFFSGLYNKKPAEIISEIRFVDNYVNTNKDIALHLVDLIVSEHQIMFSPIFIAMDELLSQALSIYVNENNVDKNLILSMVDYEVMYLLQKCDHKAIKEIHHLLRNPNQIKIYDEKEEHTIEIKPRKTYKKQPLVNGISILNLNRSALDKFKKIESLNRNYYVSIRN